MLGSGIFINTTNLARLAGGFGAISYLLIGILMTPLVICIADLLHRYPTGGFYTFAQKELNSFFGFFSSWCYFTSKLASAILVIHIAMQLLMQLIPTLVFIPHFLLDLGTLTIFICLNMFNVRTGSIIQTLFMMLKMIPILFIIGVGSLIFSFKNFQSSSLLISGIPPSLPLVLHAILGFEAAASISSVLKNPEKNGPRAVLISYGIVIILLFSYQLIFYGAVGSVLGTLPDFSYAFPTFLSLVFKNEMLYILFVQLIRSAIAASALGGAYGILFSNNWNLYTLAINNHTFFSSLFKSLNRYGIPWACVLAEGVICIIYLLFTKGNQIQIPLQQIGALGCTISYSLSALALAHAVARQGNLFSKKLIIPILGIINCLLLIVASMNSLFAKGATSLLIFSILLLFGILMFIIKQIKHKMVLT